MKSFGNMSPREPQNGSERGLGRLSDGGDGARGRAAWPSSPLLLPFKAASPPRNVLPLSLIPVQSGGRACEFAGRPPVERGRTTRDWSTLLRLRTSFHNERRRVCSESGA